MTRPSLTTIQALAAGIVTGTICVIAGAVATLRGVPVAPLAAGGAAVTCGLVFLIHRRFMLARRRVSELEDESLEIRRSLYHLRHERGESRIEYTSVGSATRDAERRAQLVCDAVTRIAAELSESRVLESAAGTAVDLLGCPRASVFMHDRRTDRFLRGFAIKRGEHGLEREELTPKPEDEAVMRLAIKRRGRVERFEKDASARAAYEAADADLAVATPLFDRAIATGVILADGPLGPGSGAAIEVIAATTSLALATARMRGSPSKSGSDSSSRDKEAKSHAQS